MPQKNAIRSYLNLSLKMTIKLHTCQGYLRKSEQIPIGLPSSNASIAFAISVCEELLNPGKESIQITEEVLKYKLRKNQVRFAFYVNNA